MWVRLSVLVIEDKNWTKKKNIKEICSLLDPWQLQRLMSVEMELRWEKLFCGTFYMNEAFVYNKCPGDVLFYSNSYSVLSCGPGLLLLVMKDINGCVEVDIFQISFGF